jgi:hypothetical protein
MIRKSKLSIFADIFSIALVCLAMGFLASCGSSNSNIAPQPVIKITANSGYTATAAVGSPFGALSATVTSNGSPAGGVSVTFTAPSSGASGLFASATPAVTDTETTSSSGVATSQIFTANSTTGSYSVTASTPGATTSASFALTNTASVAPTIAITAGSGSNQSAQVGVAFAAPLVANVTSNGTALSGATVTFAAPASGASCVLSATTAVTNANGNASVTCTANSTAGGPYNVTASTSGATTSASFALTNTASVAPTIAITAASGSNQSAQVGAAFTLPLVANVTSNGTAVNGATVTFSAPASGVSCALSATTAITNASGNASVTCTANSTTGSYSVTASTSGAVTPASFSLTNTAAPPPTIAISAASGSNQSTQVGAAFTAALVANVTSNGTALSGATVTFVAPASGASCALSATTATTNASGNASVTCTANSTAGGPYTVTASTSGTTAQASFALTNTAGPATTLTATSGGVQSAPISTAFTNPLVATATDVHGNPVSGVSVSFAAPASGASCVLSATSATTAANGTASVMCTANSTAGGPYNVVASSTGLNSVDFALTNTAGAPANLTATSGGGQSATVGAAFTNPLVATVTDSRGNPLSGVSVTFTAPASGASGTFATAPASTIDTEMTGANGQATSKTYTANSTAGGYNVAASSPGVASVFFVETNNAGTATLTATSGGGQSTAVGTAFASPLVATVTNGGNPVSGVSVTFTAPASGASGTFATTPASTIDTETTNSSGVATSKTFTANATAGGPYNVVASSTGLSSVNFAETNTTETLTATSGGGQSTKIITRFAAPLVATVMNGSVPVSGVSVTFTAPASGASGLFQTTIPSTTDTEVTNSSGVATSQVFGANSIAGTYNVVASSGTLAPVNFTETNTPGTATTLTATGGAGQSAAVSTAFALPLQATATDSHGNTVSGVSVTFTAPASGASGLFGTSTTDTEVTSSSGVATSKTFTANSTVGGYTVVASSSGLTSANFAETNTASTGEILTATSGGGQSAGVGTAFALPLVATVTNAGSPVSGVSVTFTAPASGASGLFGTSTTDTEVTGANGQATSKTFTANSTAGGPYNVVASSSGLTSVNFAETNTSGETLTATSGGGQSATILSPFANPLVATVTNGGVPVSGVSVTFTAPASGAGGLFETTPPAATDTEVTNASGVATSKTFGANSTAGSYNVVASSTGLTSVNFAETNTAGAAKTLTATSGGGQSATISTAFTNPLVATVTDAHSNPVSGVSVTFTAPASGASGLFATTPPAITDTEVTGSNGQATSQIFTANSTAGGPYNVVASSGALTSVNFAETNTTGSTSSNTYVFYASGEDSFNGFENYYAVAGAVTIDSNGTVTGGEQDYNDANGGTSPLEPTPDTITGGTLTVNSTTGQGTLTLTTNNSLVGSPLGTEVFAVQFVNKSHALIAEYDGWATSSGSLDLQTVTSAANGSYAFAAVGVDNTTSATNPDSSVAIGGVVTASSGSLSGVYDINDSATEVVETKQTISPGAALSGTDSFGRGTITGSGLITTDSVFAFYVVGPAAGSQALRIIDVDSTDVAIGSAYGQGSSTTFTNASLTSDVFTLLGQFSETYATLGEFTTDPTTGKFSAGTADDNELDNGVLVEAASISPNSTYNLVGTLANGYGAISLNWNGVDPGNPPQVATLGLYMVDPTLNINDPNNTTSADVGGAVIIDMDANLPGGMGVITPQTKTTVSSFNGTYVAGFQEFNNYTNCPECEIDMVSQGTMTTGAALSLTGDDSDPFGLWTGTPAESTGDTFTSTPHSVSTGIYSMSTANSNPLEATINLAVSGGPFGLDVDIYQASGTTLYWLEVDTDAVFLGPIEQLGSLNGIPAAEKPAQQPQPQPNTSKKPLQKHGGTSQ